jgi:signal transduction histidine kinase
LKLYSSSLRMTLLQKLADSGIHFASSTSQRRSILLSNLVSLILFGLAMVLFVAYYWWYGWSVVTAAIPVAAVLCLSGIVLNHFNLSTIGRVWLALLVPVMTIAVSIYAKNLYYEYQEELDYFTFRFIMLATCVFPAIFFSFREKKLLFITSAAGLLILMAHDPLHEFFGVPYRKDVLKESNYAFTNIVILVTYGVMMGAVFFLKWASESSEEKAEKLIRELNQMNEEQAEKNTEIEAQNQEIIAQAENLNMSQHKLKEAYDVITAQKELLLLQNQNLSSELTDASKDLSATNAELIKHNNELRQFSYTVSHNLRGPVASLMGLIGLIDQKNLSSENAEIHQHLLTSVKRLDSIISDLSKIIDIRHDIFHIRQRINLAAEADEILNGFKKDIDAYQIVVKTDFSKCTEIYSVRPMVHSILYNLISNAIKYRTPASRPEIEISSAIDQNYVIRIRDNGLGIDLKKHKNNLFKLYKRFHFHTEGKGLGLYLVKLQAETLGGSVEVESEINRHTTFTVYLGQPQNIQQQILYQEPYARIFFDATINAIGAEWHGPLSSEQYRNAFLKCLEFVKAYNTPNYIADISDQGYIAREDQQWMFEKIMPEAAQYGLKRIAAVRSGADDAVIRQYLKSIHENLLKLGIRQEYFLTLNEAMDWIQVENEKHRTV